MSATRVFALSLTLALLINALVTVGAAVAAIDTSQLDLGPTDLIVSNVRGSTALSSTDVTAIAQQLSGQASVGPVVSGTLAVNVSGLQVQAQVQGVPSNFPQLLPWQTDQGRFLSSQDDASLNRVAVIDQALAQQLFGQNGAAAIGGEIRIRDIPFTIVGVGSDSLQQNVVLVPFRTAQIRLFGPFALSAIVLRIESSTQATDLRNQAETVLRTRHNLRTAQADDFTVSNVTAPASSAITSTRVLQVIQQFGCTAKNICPRNGA